jgi:predicted XRE-type DNA-binding protein
MADLASIPPQPDTGSEITRTDAVQRVIATNGGVERPEPTVIFTKDGKPMTDEIGQMLEVASLLVRYVILIAMAAGLKSKSSKPGVGFEPKFRALTKVVESTSANIDDKIATLKECCLLLMEKLSKEYFTFLGGAERRSNQIGDLAKLVVTVVGESTVEQVLYQMFDFNELDRAARFFDKGIEIVDFKVDELNLTDAQVSELKQIVSKLADKMNPLAENLRAAEESYKELVEVCRKLQMKQSELLEAIVISTSRISKLEEKLKTSQSDCGKLKATAAPPSSPDDGADGAVEGASVK